MSGAATSAVPYSPTVVKGGKWLLAPLQGLPFDEMVKNGEGNRHAGDPNYYRMILIHGLFATFAFLIFTPAAIICARFLIHGPNPRLAMGGHIGFQIASVICLTIAFLSGYFAIDKGSWGKNPHHVIGAVLYAAMLFQVFFGAFVRWRVNKKIRRVPPLHKMIHQWLGRAVFMLGLAQIPLGLYVYGSPKSLFVLFSVCAFLFLAAWFVLEYLRNCGWFEHRYGSVSGNPTGIPEMTERHHDERHSHDMEHGYRPVGMDETTLQTPKRTRFSKLSWPFNRRSSGRHGGETIGVPYPYDTATLDSSRVPSAQSPTIGGLAPGPGRRNEDIPPVPRLPAQHGQQHSVPVDDYQQQYGPPAALKDTVLRDSTTLGPPIGRHPHIDMPESHIPLSPTGAPIFGGTPLSSDVSRSTQPSYQQPARYNMPVSPIAGGGYMEGELGFVPTPSPAGDSPRRPLPLPPPGPHRRDRSNDSVTQMPQAQPPVGAGQSVAVGGEGSSGAAGGRGPNVAVQVKLNPDGKSVTVRRLMPEEAERERRERSRARQERALQRELEMERERQSRRSQSGDRHRIRRDSMDRREREVMEDSPRDLRSPVDSYSASAVSGQSSTIAANAGGLLGRPPPEPPTPSNEPTPNNNNAISPLFGMRPVTRSPIPPGAISSSQRASVTSGGGTAENSEIEQEIVKEQRRKKRREERAGERGPTSEGGFYGPQGPESQWT
ncbi:hypothetical protein FN846DRAFT_784163 [Sphaerosporella brunnea]|uniref:Cytochrome b561 domain-containing protein n=1 Tax=Sphaerosporella brunnea TaxID=1250544 RepID=A0A5J5ELD7_9PEZI|nr:hypothetical protein FN846DRAFT_784163 [Sphaerosporella brunnea]